MQQFVIPQFISNEPSILGPIKVRQFVILLVFGGILFLIFRLSDFALFVVLSLPITGFAIVLAFYEPNGRPFHFFLLNLVQTLRRPSLRVWRKQVTADEIKEEWKMVENQNVSETKVVTRARPSTSRLAELSLVVDTGGVYSEENK